MTFLGGWREQCGSRSSEIRGTSRDVAFGVGTAYRFSTICAGDDRIRGVGPCQYLIVPALVPIFFFVTLLDILMSAIYRSSSDGDLRGKYQLVIKVEVVCLVMMMGAWMPLFWGVLNPQ